MADEEQATQDAEVEEGAQTPSGTKAGSKQAPTAEDAEGDDTQGLVDSHGQKAVSKERADKEIKKRDAQIANLQARLKEAAKSEEGRKQLNDEIAALRADIEDRDVSLALSEAGCKGKGRVKAAKALLADYENDVAKLKEAEPWLFEEEKPQGMTGGKPVSAPQDGMDEKLDAAMGIKKKG